MEQNSTVSFISTPGFCSDCGSILPLLGDKGNVTCYACKRVWGPEGIYYLFKFILLNFFCFTKKIKLLKLKMKITYCIK